MSNEIKQYPNMLKGTLISLLSAIVFALLYYYATLLKPLTGLDIYGWRVLFTLPFLTLFLACIRSLPLITDLWQRIKVEKKLWFAVPFSSALFSVQIWVFLWAPVNGRSLEVSLGYLLMPLIMVVVGRILFNERPNRLQVVAVSFALLGVINQLYQLGTISWPMVLVAVGFPIYFSFRRVIGTDNLGGLWFDMLLMIPSAIIVLINNNFTASYISEFPRLFIQIPILGLISALALALYIIASRLLPLIVFGLLSYFEPVLLVGVGLILGESISKAEMPTYGGVGIAILILVIDGVRKVWLKYKTQKLL